MNAEPSKPTMKIDKDASKRFVKQALSSQTTDAISKKRKAGDADGAVTQAIDSNESSKQQSRKDSKHKKKKKNKKGGSRR